MGKKGRKTRKTRKARKTRKTRKKRRRSNIKQIAKRIRIDGETMKSALKRAKHIQRDAPPYEPDEWNYPDFRRNPHNCYTYFLNKQDPKLTAKCKETKCQMRNPLKPQPGYWAYYPRIENKSKYNCDIMVKRMLADNPHLIKTNNMKCPAGYSSGALTVHPGLTYHYYRQDNDGLWSHKDGATNAKRLDSDGKYILDPKKANRNYPKKHIDDGTGKKVQVNYKDFCGYFCVPSNPDLKNWHSGVRIKSGGSRKRKKRKDKYPDFDGLTAIDIEKILTY